MLTAAETSQSSKLQIFPQHCRDANANLWLLCIMFFSQTSKAKMFCNLLKHLMLLWVYLKQHNVNIRDGMKCKEKSKK